MKPGLHGISLPCLTLVSNTGDGNILLVHYPKDCRSLLCRYASR
jgi:hypothetical protein